MAEQHTNKRQRYHKYKRGQFVIVRFGKRIGTEFSGTHPAIVISKEDNLFSPSPFHLNKSFNCSLLPFAKTNFQ